MPHISMMINSEGITPTMEVSYMLLVEGIEELKMEVNPESQNFS